MIMIMIIIITQFTEIKGYCNEFKIEELQAFRP